MGFGKKSLDLVMVQEIDVLISNIELAFVNVHFCTQIYGLV